MIALVNLPRSSFLKSPFPIGTPVSLTPLSLMRFLTASFTMLIALLYPVIPKENYADSVPCRTLDVQYFQPVFFALYCAAYSGIAVRFHRNTHKVRTTPGTVL